MNSLPTTVQAQDHFVQLEHNNDQAVTLFTALFPSINQETIMNMFTIISYLQETQVNPQILPRVIRGIHNVMIGTGLGQIIVHVRGNETNVSVRETDAQELKTRL